MQLKEGNIKMDIKNYREAARLNREIADTLDEMADLLEDEEITDVQLQERGELLAGRMLRLSSELRSVSDQWST